VMFTAFLYFTYYPERFSGSRRRWLDIRQLAIEWYFPHQAAIAIQKLYTLRQMELSLHQRMLLSRIIPNELFERQRMLSRRKLYVIQLEDDEDDSTTEESSVDDETT
jgi:hypothetical protein